MFEDNTKEAMEFYHSILGGKLDLQSYGEAGMSNDPDLKTRIIHAMLVSDQVCIMASDNHPEHSSPTVMGNNVHLSLVGTDNDTLTKWFNHLAQGGNIDMPLEKQFWGDTYGMLTDKFGIHWTVNISAKTSNQ
jgi:PhnB protein